MVGEENERDLQCFGGGNLSAKWGGGGKDDPLNTIYDLSGCCGERIEGGWRPRSGVENRVEGLVEMLYEGRERDRRGRGVVSHRFP